MVTPGDIAANTPWEESKIYGKSKHWVKNSKKEKAFLRWSKRREFLVKKATNEKFSGRRK